jgi:glycosyltransferase involved in cell wall biosynthesis
MAFANERFRLLRYFAALWQLSRRSRRFQPDVVWASTFAGCVVLGLWNSWTRATIGTIHGGGVHRRYPSKNRVDRIGDWLGIRFMKNCSAVVTVSEEARRLILAKLPLLDSLKKLNIVYSSITFDETRFKSRQQSLSLLPSLDGKRILLTVSRLVEAKGHDLVIDILPDLLKVFPDLIYVIVGEGPEMDSLRQRAARLLVNQNVVFAGYVNDDMLEAYYALCDVFVMAGRWTEHFVEGFGLVFLEAGARGKPVIGTRVGGIPEAIFDGLTGFVVNQEDKPALRERIEQLLRDESLRQQFGEEAQHLIRHQFTVRSMAENNASLISIQLQARNSFAAVSTSHVQKQENGNDR